MKSESVGRRKLKRIIERDGAICYYCKTAGVALTIDHVVPRSKGGGSAIENLVAACNRCNSKKGSRPADEFLGMRFESPRSERVDHILSRWPPEYRDRIHVLMRDGE